MESNTISENNQHCVIYTEGSVVLAVSREENYFVFHLQCPCCQRFLYFHKIYIDDPQFDISEFRAPTSSRAQEIMKSVSKYIDFLRVVLGSTI